MPSSGPRLTRVLEVDPSEPDPELIREAAVLLKAGALVAFPTETVYGLGAHALTEAAVLEVFEAKGRPATDPLIVHLWSEDEVAMVARDVPDVVRDLAARFWPGPLTIVLFKQPHVPSAVTAGRPTVGVRVPAHPVARALLEESRIPIAAPSANRFSRPSPTCAEHVLADLNGRIDLVLDGGPTPVGVESTVLDLTVSPPLVRRPGGVTIEALRAILPDVRAVTHVAGDAEAQAAPGQLLRHYAPRARLTLYLGEPAAVTDRMGADTRQLTGAGQRVGILAPEEDLMALAPLLASLAAAGRVRFANYGARRDPARAARELFAALRRLDDDGVDEILASAPEGHDIGAAIHDRLTRAAEGRVKRL